MFHDLKAFGSAVFAVIAISAIVASAAIASNPGTFSAEKYPVEGHGEPTVEGGSFTLSGNEIKCENVLGSGVIVAATSTLTVSGSITGCKSGTSPATATMNGCNLVVHAGNTVGPNSWGGSGDVSCPAGKVGEFHIYNSGLHATATCTATFGSVNGLSGITATNEATSPSTVSVSGTVEGIPSQLHGSCSFGFTLNTQGTLHVAGGTITGTGGVGVKIS